MTPEDRKKVLDQAHPHYTEYKDTWTILLDAFEGRGGFLNGGYLWPYPRESNDDFSRRQAMARYHNYLETLVDLYVRFVFTQGVKRDSKSKDYNTWLEDVDGAGTAINDFLKRYAAIALVNGHAGMLVDKTSDAPAGPTKADEKARVIASSFTAPAIMDWRFEGEKLTAVKLLEMAPQPSIVAPLPVEADAHQYLLWDETGWARFDAKGQLVASDMPELGLVPLVVLRPKPSQLSRMLGRALVSNANVIRALFNRAAEEDQVIREQAFSVLTVSVSPDGDVDQAKAQLGGVIGTAKALVVKGQIDYKTPDQSVPGTIRDNMIYLVQEIYRAAHMRFNRDSLTAETAEAIRLQHTELNEMLQGFAKALALAEQQMARAYFGWSTPTPEAGKAAYEAAQVKAEYPTEFFLDALLTDLQAWAEGIRMGLGVTMNHMIKKRAVRRIDPDLKEEDLKKIDAEIDALPDDSMAMIPYASDIGGDPPFSNQAQPPSGGGQPQPFPPQKKPAVPNA